MSHVFFGRLWCVVERLCRRRPQKTCHPCANQFGRICNPNNTHLNKSEWVPVRYKETTITVSFLLYISSQSGVDMTLSEALLRFASFKSLRNLPPYSNSYFFIARPGFHQGSCTSSRGLPLHHEWLASSPHSGILQSQGQTSCRLG